MTDERGMPRAGFTCLTSWPACLPACFSPSVCMMTFRFWDCCGKEREDAPGCVTGWHLASDDQLNEVGWI